MGISKNKKRNFKARSIRLNKLKATEDNELNTSNKKNLINRKLEEVEMVSSSESEYFPSQSIEDNSSFKNVLDQLLDFLIENFGSEWKNLAKRNISALLCLTLKQFNISNVQIELLLKSCNLLTVKTSNFWLEK